MAMGITTRSYTPFRFRLRIKYLDFDSGTRPHGPLFCRVSRREKFSGQTGGRHTGRQRRLFRDCGARPRRLYRPTASAQTQRAELAALVGVIRSQYTAFEGAASYSSDLFLRPRSTNQRSSDPAEHDTKASAVRGVPQGRVRVGATETWYRRLSGEQNTYKKSRPACRATGIPAVHKIH